MDLIRVVLRDCHFAYNDISSTKKTKMDIEVSFPKLIACFRHTFLEHSFKIHIEFLKSNPSTVGNAHEFANCLATMNCIVDSPELHLNSCGSPQYIIAIINKATMYDIAKLLIMLSRFPIIENHEENIL